MMIERIGRVVGRADGANVELAKDAVSGQLVGLQLFVGSVPDRGGTSFVELLVDASSADGRLSPHELATVKRVSAALKLNS